MGKRWLISSILIVVVLAMALLAASCGGRATEGGKIGVTVTILPLADFAEKVGGDKVDVTVMVPPGAEPHAYEPTPGQMVKLSTARMYVKVGSGLEFELAWMDKFEQQNRSMLVVDSSQGIAIMGNDPHTWLSPSNARTMVENIYQGLIKIDPENEAYYAQNRDEYLRQLDELDKEIRQGLEGVKNKAFMVFHPAWAYFARDYGLEEIAIEVEGKEPSAQDMARFIELAKTRGIKTIFASPQFNSQPARTIADEIGGKVVFIDDLAKDYIANEYTFLGYLVEELR